MDQPDGLQWIKASDGDYLIVDEDSGNDYGERKYVLPIDDETLQLEEEGTGYFLASAGGALNPRAIGEVAAIPDTFTQATSSEFSGSWNVTHLVATKEDGNFYTQEEIAGTVAQEIIEQYPLDEQTLIGVVQHRGESSGIIEEHQGDQGGQIFQFKIEGISGEEETGNPESLFGSDDADIFEIEGSDNEIYGAGGDDLIDLTGADGGNLAYAGSGDDTYILGSSDRVYGDDGDDRFFATEGGNNSINGNLGADQFWIANADIPESANTINDFTVGEDVIGIAGLGIGFGDLSFADDSRGAIISYDGSELAILSNAHSFFITANTNNFVFV